MNTDPFKSYRENATRSSSAADIYIQCYDEVIRLLHSAARAMEDSDIEMKTYHLNRALAFIVHLQAALGIANGVVAAHWLNQFYVLVRKQIFEGSARLDPDALRQVAGYFAEVRKLWEEGRAMSSGKPASGPSPLLYDSPSRPPQEATPATGPDMTDTSCPAGWKA